MLTRSYKPCHLINLFIVTADQWYGPITTICCDGHVLKHIPWTVFTLMETDWAWVKEVAEILADSNQIQQYFSAEKQLTLWRALPAIEEVQTAWEAKLELESFAKYHEVINDGLKKIMKYYSHFDEKPAFIIAPGECQYRYCSNNRHLSLVALHPYYKLAYIELAWGGAKEQEAEHQAGNPHSKNWQDEAHKILEATV